MMHTPRMFLNNSTYDGWILELVLDFVLQNASELMNRVITSKFQVGNHGGKYFCGFPVILNMNQQKTAMNLPEFS